MLITLVAIGALTIGILIGTFLVPILAVILKRKRQFNAASAEQLVKQARLNERLDLRKSIPFKKRFKETLAMIQSEASENKRELKVAFVVGCKTDKEIKSALEELRFECYETSDNTLRISW
jgi:uncharacterized membrane protein YhiD involved in acid resistance